MAPPAGPSGSPLGGDLVAGAPHGLDGAGVPELAAQLAHVDVDGAAVAEEGEAPDTLEQLLAGEHEAAVLDQRHQEVELLGRERDRLAGDEDLAPADLDPQLVQLDGRGLGLPARR